MGDFELFSFWSSSFSFSLRWWECLSRYLSMPVSRRKVISREGSEVLEGGRAEIM